MWIILLILKRVEYMINDVDELEQLLRHLRETTAKVPGVELKDIVFPQSRTEFVLMLDCVSEEKYLEWRVICPPPSGAKDWYEVFLTKEEMFSKGIESDTSIS